MRNKMYETEKKVNELYLAGKNNVRKLMSRKKKGISTLVVMLLLVVVSVALVALFKTQITSLLNSIFTKVNSEVTGTLFSEPSV